MASKTQLYAENGIILSKTPAYVGDEITVTYNGLLARCGADKVYVYVGYGEQWEKRGFVPMAYEFDTFKATFKILQPGSLNLAFKDSAENWDNNSGENYTFKVSRRQKASTKASKEEKPAKTAAKASTKNATKTSINTAAKSKETAKAKTAGKKKSEE